MKPMSAAALKPSKNTQSLVSIPAAMGGLNAYDALPSMPPTDAYDMQNWIPQQYGLRIRKGYSVWAQTVQSDNSSVKTIMPYFPSTATTSTDSGFLTNPTTFPGKVFAATDGGIYDVTSPVNTPAQVLALSGTAEAGRFSYVNFSNSAGNWLIACSEADGYFTYDGTTWLKVTAGAGATQINGVDPVKFCQTAIWKNRLWFVEKGSAHVWFLGVNSLYGTASQLDLGPLLRHGGGIAWIATWTIDAGEGIDDLLVICSENGELLVYKGTDPTSVSTFSIVGKWPVGAVPKGRRGFCQYGGDLLVLSTAGITPLSYVTRGGSDLLMASKNDYTRKIMQQFNSALSTSFNQYGWDMIVHPKEQVLVVMVPDNTATVSLQYAMDLGSGAWTKLQGFNMLCAALISGWMLFGTSTGTVHLGFYGYTDNGQSIQGILQPAFSSFDSPGQQKRFMLSRIAFMADTTPNVQVSMNTDFKTVYPVAIPTLTGATASALWDSAVWDVSKWGGLPYPYDTWFAVTGVGYYGSLTVLTASIGQLILTNIDYVYEKGSVLG